MGLASGLLGLNLLLLLGGPASAVVDQVALCVAAIGADEGNQAGIIVGRGDVRDQIHATATTHTACLLSKHPFTRRD